MNYSMFMDDTAIDKSTAKSDVLKNELATMVSVLIPTSQVPTVRNKIIKLKNKYGVSEFHFTDIYNRKKEFKNSEAETTLAILKDFVKLVKSTGVKFITQTITNTFETNFNNIDKNIDAKNQLIKTLNYIGLPTLGDNLYKSYATFINIVMTKKYLTEIRDKSVITNVVCDQGLLKENSEVNIFGLFKNPIALQFKNSAKEELLQLADFGAWGVSRVKQSLNKHQGTEIKEFEQEVIKIFEPIVPYYPNLNLTVIDPKNVPSYDNVYKELTTK